MNKDLLLQNIFVGLVVALVVLSVWFGARSGKALAQSKLILAHANAVTTGLGFFYQDYDRFPSLLEYQSPELMAVYFSKWPPLELSGKLCSQSLSYDSPRFNQYILSVCLPSAKDGMNKGQSQFTIAK